MDGQTIQGVEINAFLRAANDADYILNQIGGSVRNADPKSNPRAHGRFAFLDSVRDGVAKFRFDFSGRHEVVDQLVNGLPAIACLQINNHFFPCSRMILSMPSASGDCSSARRNSALCRSLAMLASVWRCF